MPLYTNALEADLVAVCSCVGGLLRATLGGVDAGSDSGSSAKALAKLIFVPL